MDPRPPLRDVIARLHEEYGDPFLPPTTEPFGLILWEQVAYLVDDSRRTAAFERLTGEVGETPAAILAAPLSQLEGITAAGGRTAAKDRAGRMRTSAEIVNTRWDGDLQNALALPFAQARKALQRFPMIGPPGADKILLLTGTYPVLALDSNGLRVLLRLGYGSEKRSYSDTYGAVQEAVTPAGGNEIAWLSRAYGVLRHHGQNTCRRSTPQCEQCPVEAACPGSRLRHDP